MEKEIGVFGLFVCLFMWSLSSHSRIFHSYGDVTIAGEVQILTAAVVYLVEYG